MMVYFNTNTKVKQLLSKLFSESNFQKFNCIERGKAKTV